MKLLRNAFIIAAIACCPALANGWEAVDLGAKFAIQGKVPNMQQQIESSGFAFDVELQDIQYSGKVHRTIIEPTADDCFTVWVALRNAVLTIDHTDIEGRRHSAKCGPLDVVLGSQRFLWVAFDVQRSTKSGVQKLNLKQTRFHLPRDNWSVGEPAWVKTSGFGMTKGKVTNGLRSGIAKNAPAIERQFIQAAPQIFAQVEKEIGSDLKATKLVVAKVATTKRSTRR